MTQDKWYIQLLEGSALEVVGDITLDTEGGVVLFRDESAKLVAFQNLGAVAYGELLEEEDS
jgi:hypothetical protein